MFLLKLETELEVTIESGTCIPYIDHTVSKKVFITFWNNMQFSWFKRVATRRVIAYKELLKNKKN